MMILCTGNMLSIDNNAYSVFALLDPKDVRYGVRQELRLFGTYGIGKEYELEIKETKGGENE